jgi:hypothetical protein
MRFALLERVPDNNQTASCITHPARGCSLLRDVRSDTCNNHVCESLTSIHAAKRRAKPVHAVVILGRKLDNFARHGRAPGEPVQRLRAAA